MMTYELTEFLQKLIQTPSVNGRDLEKDIVNVIAQECIKLQLPYQIIAKDPKRPNIFVGESLTNKEDVLLVAHLDTVPEGQEKDWKHKPFQGDIEEGKIYGRGAIDCKGGIAVALYAMKTLFDKGIKNIKFVGVADEESGADSKIGLRHLLDQGLNAKGAIYLYGSSRYESISIGHRGLVRLWVTCHGESAHAGSSEWQNKVKGENSITGIMDLLNQIKSINGSSTNPYFNSHKLVITPTLMESGIGESIVPKIAKVLLDIRTVPEFTNDEVIKRIQLICNELSTEKRKYEITIKNNLPAVLSDPESEFIKLIANNHQNIFNLKPKLKASGPANESYMLIEKGIPTVAGYGPKGSGMHGVDEYAEIESMEQSIEFIKSLFKD